jgi:hypothetical protein
MKNKFTLAAVAVAVALGAYMIFVEAKKEAPTESQEVTVWSLTDNQAKDLNTLVVKAEGKEAKYVREGDKWRLSTEPKRDLDAANWDVPYKNLKDLTAQRKVEDKAADLGKYGLAKPNTTVQWGDEKTPYKLEVGDKNPAGDAYYVHAAKDDAIYTVSTWKVDDWRKWATNPPLAALPSPSPSPSPMASPAAKASSAPGASPAASAAPASAKPVAMPSKK